MTDERVNPLRKEDLSPQDTPQPPAESTIANAERAQTSEDIALGKDPTPGTSYESRSNDPSISNNPPEQSSSKSSIFSGFGTSEKSTKEDVDTDVSVEKDKNKKRIVDANEEEIVEEDPIGDFEDKWGILSGVYMNLKDGLEELADIKDFEGMQQLKTSRRYIANAMDEIRKAYAYERSTLTARSIIPGDVDPFNIDRGVDSELPSET